MEICQFTGELCEGGAYYPNADGERNCSSCSVRFLEQRGYISRAKFEEARPAVEKAINNDKAVD